MKQLVDLVKEPLHAMKATIKDLIKDIGKAVQPLRDVIVRVVRVFTSVRKCCCLIYLHIKTL